MSDLKKEIETNSMFQLNLSLLLNGLTSKEEKLYRCKNIHALDVKYEKYG